MTALAITLAAMSCLVALVWFSRHLMIWREKRAGQLLRAECPGPPEDAPKISVMVAAKDEASLHRDLRPHDARPGLPELRDGRLQRPLRRRHGRDRRARRGRGFAAAAGEHQGTPGRLVRQEQRDADGHRDDGRRVDLHDRRRLPAGLAADAFGRDAVRPGHRRGSAERPAPPGDEGLVGEHHPAGLRRRDDDLVPAGQGQQRQARPTPTPTVRSSSSAGPPTRPSARTRPSRTASTRTCTWPGWSRRRA